MPDRVLTKPAVCELTVVIKDHTEEQRLLLRKSRAAAHERRAYLRASRKTTKVALSMGRGQPIHLTSAQASASAAGISDRSNHAVADYCKVRYILSAWMHLGIKHKERN
eukprot:6191173-Pleurochrysis_carterae.AAC.1